MGGANDARVGVDAGADGVYFTADDAGRSRIYALSTRNGDVRLLDPEGRGVYAGVQAAGGKLLARWESGSVPAEIVRVGTKGGHDAISGFNAEQMDGVDLRPFVEFWFENSSGRQVHSWLVLPPDFDETKKYPLVLQIHGGPFASSMDSQHVRWSASLLAAPGYVVLMTDYTGSVGYGADFSRAIGGDPLKTPGQDLLEAAAAAIERIQANFHASCRYAAGRIEHMSCQFPHAHHYTFLCYCLASDI